MPGSHRLTPWLYRGSFSWLCKVVAWLCQLSIMRWTQVSTSTVNALKRLFCNPHVHGLLRGIDYALPVFVCKVKGVLQGPRTALHSKQRWSGNQIRATQHQEPRLKIKRLSTLWELHVWVETGLWLSHIWNCTAYVLCRTYRRGHSMVFRAGTEGLVGTARKKWRQSCMWFKENCVDRI